MRSSSKAAPCTSSPHHSEGGSDVIELRAEVEHPRHPQHLPAPDGSRPRNTAEIGPSRSQSYDRRSSAAPDDRLPHSHAPKTPAASPSPSATSSKHDHNRRTHIQAVILIEESYRMPAFRSCLCSKEQESLKVLDALSSTSEHVAENTISGRDRRSRAISFVHELRSRARPSASSISKGNQAVDTLFYNAHDYTDRYSAQDTIREQANIYLTTGTKPPLHPNATPSSPSPPTPAAATTPWAAPAPQKATWFVTVLEKRSHARLSAKLRQGRAGLVVRTPAATSAKRDLTANINFFMNVPCYPRRQASPLKTASPMRRQVRRAPRRDGRPPRHLELPPAQQSRATPTTPRPIDVLIWSGDQELGHHKGMMFKKVLIANRGAIACRIERTLSPLGC